MSGNSDWRADTWEEVLRRRLPDFGHRNWIVVADSAYPEQSNCGIEAIATGSSHMDVLEKTLISIGECKHIRAKPYLDSELKHVSELDAPGVTEYRRQLDHILGNRDISRLEHEQIISKLDEAGKLFRVLILKSNFTIPCSSAFLELDCKYWNANAERRLRCSLASG